MNNDLIRIKTLINRTEHKSPLEMLRQSTKPVIVCDISGSMSERINAERSRWDALNSELVTLLPANSDNDVQLIAFHSTASFASLPLQPPTGGTALHLALQLAASLRPSQIIVISDGQPDNRQAALDTASTLLNGVRIDTIFVGDDTDISCKQFMANLATQSGGSSFTSGDKLLTVQGQLAAKLSGLLTA